MKQGKKDGTSRLRARAFHPKNMAKITTLRVNLRVNVVLV